MDYFTLKLRKCDLKLTFVCLVNNTNSPACLIKQLQEMSMQLIVKIKFK